MTIASPAISVLVATRDRPTLLVDALQSLLEQRFRSWEAVIIDSGCHESVCSTVQSLGDSRLHYHRSSTPLGECEARNVGLGLCRGEFVCYLDDDDQLPEDSLDIRYCAMARQPSHCGMVYADYLITAMDSGGAQMLEAIPSNPQYLTKRYYDRLVDRLMPDREAVHTLLKQFNFIRGGSPLLRRRAVKEVGGFDQRLERYGDYDLWLKISAKFSLCRLDEVVYIYRLHDGCHSHRINGDEDKRLALLMCRKHGISESVQWSRYHSDIRAQWKDELCIDSNRSVD